MKWAEAISKAYYIQILGDTKLSQVAGNYGYGYFATTNNAMGYNVLDITGKVKRRGF